MMPRSLRSLLVLPLLSALPATPAHALILTVDNNLDSGAGSLRAAITTANTTSALDEIRFNLDAGERVITPLTPLPVMTNPTDINGTSQPGYAGVPLVAINGATAGSTGLRFMANLSSVRGVAVYGFSTGISVEGGLSVVKSNYIGLTTSTATISGAISRGRPRSGTAAMRSVRSAPTTRSEPTRLAAAT